MRFVPCIGLVSALGCSASNGVSPGVTVRRPATIAISGDSASLVVPATARPNVPFAVTFKTYRGGCDSAAQNDVTTSSMAAEIQSYENEFQPQANGACADYLLVDTNSVAVTFLSVGTGHVILHGRQDPGGTLLTVDRAVTVTSAP